MAQWKVVLLRGPLESRVYLDKDAWTARHRVNALSELHPNSTVTENDTTITVDASAHYAQTTRKRRLL
jgi:hypothetical protein